MNDTNQTGKSRILTKSRYSSKQKGIFVANINSFPQRPDAKPSIAELLGSALRLFERSESFMPEQIEKRRKSAGRAWAALLFGSFILGIQNK